MRPAQWRSDKGAQIRRKELQEASKSRTRLDAENVHSNWTKEASEGWLRKRAAVKQNAVIAAGVEGKSEKTQITINKVGQQKQKKKTRVKGGYRDK